MSPNNGILLNGVLRSKLLNYPFAACFLINFLIDFLMPHTADFDDSIALPFFSTFVFKILDLSAIQLAHLDACLIK